MQVVELDEADARHRVGRTDQVRAVGRKVVRVELADAEQRRRRLGRHVEQAEHGARVVVDDQCEVARRHRHDIAHGLVEVDRGEARQRKRILDVVEIEHRHALLLRADRGEQRLVRRRVDALREQ